MRFQINYKCAGDEWLAIEGDFELELSSCDGVTWSAEGDLPLGEWGYSYVVCSAHGVVRREMEVCISPKYMHRVEVVGECGNMLRRDEWIDYQITRPMSSKFFTQSVFKRHAPMPALVNPAVGHVVEFNLVEVDSNYDLVVVGSTPQLGEWRVADGVVMSDARYPLWRAMLPASSSDCEYKIVVVERSSGAVVAWEMGENRVARGVDSASLTVDSVATPRFDMAPWRGRGVAIPVFSLRTERSMGVGDFGDIRSMVDWAADRDMSVIQILPINDTTMSSSWEDSYPYNANSTMALHPQYIAPDEVGELRDEQAAARYRSRGRELNGLSKIDYTAVNQLKQSWLRDLYTQDGETLRRDADYCEFMAANCEWLAPYALFSVLRNRYSTPDFSQWEEYAVYDSKLLQQSEFGDEMEYHYFVQYHLHCQLLQAVEYAHSRGVALKGDIPIGISRTSVDAWVSPELFRMDMQAGAPPDAFARLGQNWGFPTYNWERMSLDGYGWWRRRMVQMSRYFDAYRIDHILGFFRIWQIPTDVVHGILGHFSPALPLSAQQIGEWGMTFGEEYLRPRITDEVLSHYLSPENVARAKGEYLAEMTDGRYAFLPHVDTQRKVCEVVDDEVLRDGLMSLFDEVLFVRDSVVCDNYHPRISAYETMVYAALSDGDRQAFDGLYNDFYYRRHDDFWRRSALEKLPSLICSTDMLVCGEDLGMIPACVADVMEREQILSLEIERMPKGVNCEFGTPSDYPYLSVCTTSTHDMSTIRGWWREDGDQTQRYFNRVLGLEGVAPADCSGDIAVRIVDRHTQSPAMLTILPWQDWMAMDEQLRSADVDGERINVPAISRHYWRYRMHIEL